MYIYIYAQLYIRMCIYIYMHNYTYVYVYIYICTTIHTYMYIYIYMYDPRKRNTRTGRMVSGFQKPCWSDHYILLILSHVFFFHSSAILWGFKINPHGRAQPQNQLQCCPHLVNKDPPVRDVQQQTVLRLYETGGLSQARQNRYMTSHRRIERKTIFIGIVALRICKLILGYVGFGLSRAMVSSVQSKSNQSKAAQCTQRLTKTQAERPWPGRSGTLRELPIRMP